MADALELELFGPEDSQPEPDAELMPKDDIMEELESQLLPKDIMEELVSQLVPKEAAKADDDKQIVLVPKTTSWKGEKATSITISRRGSSRRICRGSARE